MHPNRLAREKSPYLLQHAHNPVDWYAWGEEAFSQARREQKPIFLSIGYSTCHWCHVMERESFENEAVAARLNRHFVSVKVDREERPDVDRIYLTFVQLTTGSGGWPLNVFLTPTLKPFYGGTYFPPANRAGRPGFLHVLERIVALWQDQRHDIASSAEGIHAQLAEIAAGAKGTSEVALNAEVLRQAGRALKQSYDPRHGGFGGAPKFPQPSQPAFLLRYARRFEDEEAVGMVLHSCDRMAAGGIHDQLGGGFARYAVDAGWRVPHFEKMLYDNAQLAQLYLDAYLASGEGRHAAVVRDILGYVRRDLTHPGGGFYSAEDADSEGHEGKFYCWTRAELERLLPRDQFDVAVRCFGVTEEGNFVDHSHPQPLQGQNVLSVFDPKLSAAEAALLAAAKATMNAARSRRVRPLLDDKILASWNGLMLGAMARAGAVLGEESYRAAAEQCLAFLREALWDSGTATLHHRWRDGERDHAQLLEAYAFLLAGVVDLYEATLEPGHLDLALDLAEGMIARFYDEEGGGFWQAPPGGTELIVRVKEDYDGAVPAGNSVATLALLRLAAIAGRAELKPPAEATLRLFSARLQNTPQALPVMLQALDFWMDEPRRVVIAGDPKSVKARALLHATHAVFQPNKVVLGTAGAVEPFARTLPVKDWPAAYVCTGTSCQPPTSDAAQLKSLLG